MKEPLDVLRTPAGQRLAACRIAAAMEPHGPLFELERAGGVPVEELGTRDCVLRYYAYRRAFAAAKHADALACFDA